MRKKIIALAQLLRLPNLFTVPGDPIVGYCIMLSVVKGGGIDKRLFIAIAVALLAYCYGLVTNDLVDINEDKRERPERPLASGILSRSFAVSLSVLLGGGAIVLSALVSIQVIFITFLLLGAISLYNFKFKNDTIGGPVLLGGCRVLSVLLGAVTITDDAKFLRMLLMVIPPLFFYIYGLSRVAQSETKRSIIGNFGHYFMVFGAVMWGILGGVYGVSMFFHNFKINEFLLVVFPTVLFLVIAVQKFNVIRKHPKPHIVQKTIGELIRNVMLFQVAVCATSSFVIPASILLILTYPAKLASNRFYGS